MIIEKRLTKLRTARNQRSKLKKQLLRKGGILKGKYFSWTSPGWKARFKKAQEEIEKQELRGIKAEVSKVAQKETRKPNFFQKLFSRRGK